MSIGFQILKKRISRKEFNIKEEKSSILLLERKFHNNQLKFPIANINKMFILFYIFLFYLQQRYVFFKTIF
jgi:hypothetical protein